MITYLPGVNLHSRGAVYRFIQEYSHNQEADSTRPVGRPDSVELLKAVLEYMRELDAGHFNEMCKAVDVDASRLGMGVASSAAPRRQPRIG